MIQCSLCDMMFEEIDPLFHERKRRHEEWHSHCKIQKRNTTEGTVFWRSI